MKLGLATLILLVALPAQGQELKPICPDRPGRGTSACTLEPGHAQIEIGLFDDSFAHRSGVTAETDTIGSVLAKWGVSERMDIEAGLALYQIQRTDGALGGTTAQGIGDLFLHAKYNPLAGDGPFALVLAPFLKLPTAGGGTGNGAVEGGLVLPMGLDLGNNWSLGMTPEADVQLNASGSGHHVNLVNVIGLGRSFGRFTLGAEIWTSQNLDPAGTVSQYSADLDLAFLLDNDTQLDGGFNAGLNRATPDLEFYFGISHRF